MAEDLNKIKIPLADVRALIVKLMLEGETEIGLGDFLVLLQALYVELNDH